MNEPNNIPQVQEILIGCIFPSPMNPRKTFNEDALRELAENIRQQGLLQPITVRHETYKDDEGNVHRIENSFEIVCGERRYRACKMISPIMYVPCIVRDLSDDEAFDAMVTENLQRQDVDPIEEAVAFKLLTTRGTSTDELAARFGKSVRYINDRIRLAQLQEPLRLAVSAGRITLRGGYLLARLNEADQQAFIEDEYDEDCDYTTSDIEEWLDRHFMNLWRAPFQDGKTLQETWNPEGKLIRRCLTCECNTCNHGCLFADMKTDEPQCIDEVCYNRKCDIFYDWYLSQYESRFVLAGKPATAGSVAIVRDDYAYYRDEIKARINRFADKLTSAGYRIFSTKELPVRVWSEASIEGELADGTAVECIDITEMARGSQMTKMHVRRIPNAEATRPSDPAQPSNYPARLAERSATIEKTADKKVVNYAKKNFDREKYVSQKGALMPWEQTILMAIVWDKLPRKEHDKLIPGTVYTTPTFEQMDKMVKSTMFDASWKRKAIAAFITSSYNESYLEEAMKNLSIEAKDFISKTRQDAEKRIKEINDELREMGYDEKANKL